MLFYGQKERNQTMENVLITGASSGIGMEYAKRFAQLGYNLIIVARRKSILESLAESLTKEYQIQCVVISQDLSEEGAAKRICDMIKEKGLTIDILVNNAGFATKGLLEWADYELQHKEMQVNVVALVELTYFIIAQMAQRQKGVVINIASAAAFNPVPYNSVYSATKAFVLSFTEGIAYEYRNKGIKVIAVCPQATDTHFFDHFDKMEGPMRTASQVVDTTIRALKRKKVVVPDGFFSRLQSKMHHVMTRKARVSLTGKIGKKIWGKR